MLEIFVPTLLKNKNLEINYISDRFLEAVKTLDGKIENFESHFFSGIKINLENFDENIIILCNGEFGAHYFLDYDVINNKGVHCLGVKVIGKNEIENSISKIMGNMSAITKTLQSNILLTNTKKEEILHKIKNTFFSLSGVAFLLYSLKKTSQENLEQLSNYSGKIEYEGQAQLLKETSLTKNIELQASIDTLEGKIEMFINVIGKMI